MMKALAKTLSELTRELMMIPGLSGHEDRVRRVLAKKLQALGLAIHSDRLGNLYATIEGDAKLPGVLLFAHMDQLGLVVRKIEAGGLIRVERLGGVPERALPAQSVLFCVGEGRDVPGVIAHKSHHATSQDEKYKVLPYAELYIDAGFASAEQVLSAGINVGTPVVYEPDAKQLANGLIAGTAIDDRAGCAVVLEVAAALLKQKHKPTTHILFSVLEEFNLQGAVTAARKLKRSLINCGSLVHVSKHEPHSINRDAVIFHALEQHLVIFAFRFSDNDGSDVVSGQVLKRLPQRFFRNTLLANHQRPALARRG